MADKRVRCAIYTRKSSEEGLEQSFNSLEAQQEACRAYILSQKHEGWTALNTRYDDGGFSGGTMERPALKQLLDDILGGKVETVVVYKVDRLTRSLSDFSKIIEVFDSHGVSFVSVTQQFNTTTSMGRLTLNVLLSFAQFEREVTGERIRDKIAASKRKGMWMGGAVPQGYDCVERRLIINPREASIVRTIFREYLRLGCVSELKRYLDQKQIRSKARVSAAGRTYGGATYSRGALYHLLNNRIYIGEIAHRGKAHPGLHEAIVPRELWNRVAARLGENNQAHRIKKSQSTQSLLTGKLFDSNGIRFTPTHAVKNAKRYRYYTSQTVIQQAGIKPVISRFPAQELEQFVTSQVRLLLRTPSKCTAGMKNSPVKGAATERSEEMASRWTKLETSKQHEFVRNILRRVTVGQTTVWIEIDRISLLATLLGQRPEALRPECARNLGILRLTGEFQVLRRGGELRVISPHGDLSFQGKRVPSLVKAVARARDWYERIVAGEVTTISQLAQKSGLTRRYIRRILQCGYLSPQIIEALLTGKHRPNLTLKQFLRGVPLNWREQEERLLRPHPRLPAFSW
ncbi:MAG: recombinase family protein [Acidobacteriia bacterium]|nr:recombinase family protein [Terriglobia bacterium]